MSTKCYAITDEYLSALPSREAFQVAKLGVMRTKLLNLKTISGLQSRVRRFDSDPGLHCEERKKAPLWRFIFLRIRHVLSRYVTRACLRFLAGVPECVHCYEGG